MTVVARTQMGGIFDWVANAVSTVVDTVADPIKDFSNTEVGKMVERAGATALFMSTAGLSVALPAAAGGGAVTIGPQLAALSFALPGILRGEAFDEAWTKEWIWRVSLTASMVAPSLGQQLSDAIKPAVEKLNAIAPAELLKLADGGLPALAKKLGVREDVAAAALDLVQRNVDLPNMRRIAQQAIDAKILAAIPVQLRAAVQASGNGYDPKSGKALDGGSLKCWLLPDTGGRVRVFCTPGPAQKYAVRTTRVWKPAPPAKPAAAPPRPVKMTAPAPSSSSSSKGVPGWVFAAGAVAVLGVGVSALRAVTGDWPWQ